MFTQTITPNPNIPCQPGWCLQYVRQAYGLPARYGSATEAWENSPSKHEDYNFPADVWVPLWFTIDGIPEGHVVLRAPDGSIYSSSDLGNIPHHHPDLADLIDYYARWGNLTLTFLGWSEDVAGYPVIGNNDITYNSEEEDVALTPEQDAALAYIISPQFKADIFAGTTDVERAARNAFHDELLNRNFPWYGFDGKIPETGRNTTSLKTDTAWADSRATVAQNRIQALEELVTQLSVKQGVVIDYDKIAEAVNNNAYQRMEK